MWCNKNKTLIKSIEKQTIMESCFNVVYSGFTVFSEVKLNSVMKFLKFEEDLENLD